MRPRVALSLALSAALLLSLAWQARDLAATTTRPRAELADAAALLRRARAKPLAAAASPLASPRPPRPPSPPSPPFPSGQCEQARLSVQTAIAQQPAPERGALWANVQSSLAQAERESATVRRLLADGMRFEGEEAAAGEWGGLPPPRPPNASMDELLCHVPRGGHAWLAFGNAGVSEMIFNWAFHAARLGVGWRMVVAAFDAELLDGLRARRIPAYNYTGALPATHFRHAPYLFHRMGFLKAELIVHVLRTGRHALVSDSDVVWVRSPEPLLEALLSSGATVAASTDCLDARSDEDKTTRRSSAYMCGHNPGNEVASDVVFNTGVVWFKADESAISFAREWALGTLSLTDPFSDDQGVFNRLLVRDFFPVRRHSADGRVVRGRGSLRIAPLPARHFCSGHMVWVQQASQPRDCLSVHATFTEFGDAGKKWRLLEAGLWGLHHPRYYTSGQFLTFLPPPPGADPQPCAAGEGEYVAGSTPQPCGGEDPRHGLPRVPRGVPMLGGEAYARSARLRANMALMSRQVHALRDALAIARVLNRTLILPHFDCLCDRSEDIQLIPSCIHHGAPPAMRVPFKCSQHFVADTHKLQLMAVSPSSFGMQPHKFGGAYTAPLPLRAHSFLDDPRTAPEIKAGVVDVSVGQPSPSPTDPSLPKGATNVDVLRRLQPWRDARVLRLSDAHGAFSGWETNHEQARLFSTMMEYYLLRGAWCCSSRGNGNEDGRVYPTPPPALKIPPRWR